MKTKFPLIAIVVLAVAVFILYRLGGGNSLDVQKTKEDAQAAADKTADVAKDAWQDGKDAAQAGLQKAGEVSTNLAADIKTGVSNAASMTTNAASHIRNGVTNAYNQTQQNLSH